MIVQRQQHKEFYIMGKYIEIVCSVSNNQPINTDQHSNI